MTKLLEKRKVVELRRQGKSYSEIRKIINVSKSSLTLWLRNVPLTDDQILGLKLKKQMAVERYVKSMKLKRQNRLDGYLKLQKNKWLPLSEREEFVAGLFLYSGEGNKVSSNSIQISNTDPSVIKFSYYWMNKCLGISKNKIFLKLHLYDDMDIERETEFWSKEIGVNTKQFKKPYIKHSLRTDIDQKGYSHGTCGILAFKTEIKENIMMAIKAILNSYSSKLNQI